ncbi:F-type H+-transporting ATPase subunit epsilon [Nitrosomonas cryotolerans]|uniref:F-type H+-transporting ATPase subunit epsilon n=1 Tax=Nitrosomonas cryotolerans ATCC 49181 TaxID=1131553 RepID=A0A1N6HS34_9PROT|nr:ATP synthase F0F1 subunit epsilon [Nitrosomonas cryotolerans]SFP95558.1 F-type H+-transporting ATPase subunit epsilon [Nitrosomonas cryotolerans]SIO22485.1 F-type H+-transporting ATPase subunit epsilon [Nitrosomonas cryotolerans ATCC 49181]
MNTFILHVQSATQYTCIKSVISFIGEDKSGSFGIRSRHERMMTALSYGLARYQLEDGSWSYLAFPGGILYFMRNNLYISTRRFLHDADYQRISVELLEQLLREEEALKEIKSNLNNLEQEMFRRLWQMERNGVKI